MPDHEYLCIELPLKYSVSSFMGYLKGKSALMIFDRHPEFKTRGKMVTTKLPLSGVAK